jgi:hypothetical protein
MTRELKEAVWNGRLFGVSDDDIPFERILPWERSKMTVCIAAVCRDRAGDRPAIATCMDLKISSELGSAETAWKMNIVAKHRWVCLAAGPETEVIALRRQIDREFRNAKK